MPMCVLCFYIKRTINATITIIDASTLLQNDLTFLRVRSKKHEIMIAPDKEYLLIVIQNPAAEESAK